MKTTIPISVLLLTGALLCGGIVRAQRDNGPGRAGEAPCDTCRAGRSRVVEDSLRRYAPEALKDTLARYRAQLQALQAETAALQREVAAGRRTLNERRTRCDELLRIHSPLALLRLAEVDSLLSEPLSEMPDDLLDKTIALGARVVSLNAAAARARALRPLRACVLEGRRMQAEGYTLDGFRKWNDRLRAAIRKGKSDYSREVSGMPLQSERQKKELTDLNNSLMDKVLK